MTPHRLGTFPEQRIVNVSNQVDTTQQATTRFPSLTSWIDALRTSYCALLPSHAGSVRPERGS